MTEKLPYLPIARPVTGPEELDAVRQVLESGWLTQGPWVRRFEEAFARRHGVKHAFAVTSCTTALHLALLALNIQPGDEVIVPAFTWVSTANVVIHCGARPVFVDIDPVTFNIDPAQIEAAVSKRTRALIAVHLFGLCADMAAIAAALPVGTPIIEDAACAAGATLGGRSAGGLGTIGCFSLHPRKSITCGEGGVVTTDDDALAARIDMFRNHGASISEEARHRAPRPYDLPDFTVFGFNYRLTDLQAAVACVQLTRLDGFIAERQALADRFDLLLQDLTWLRPPVRRQGETHALQAYVASVDEERAPFSRNALLERLQNAGIGSRPGTHAVVGLSVYRSYLALNPAHYPAAMAAEATSIALPLHNHMTLADVDRVVAALA